MARFAQPSRAAGSNVTKGNLPLLERREEERVDVVLEGEVGVAHAVEARVADDRDA